MAGKLSAQEIAKLVVANTIGKSDFEIIIEESLPSTNDYILDLIAKSDAPILRMAVLAETQTAGKGRQGKHWVSVPGNMLLSVYWPFEGTVDKLYGLSLVVGIAIARALKANGLHDVQLKWPNDIYWHGSKMGGILIETKQKHPGLIDVVIGIGLNIVVMDAVASEIDQKFVALEEALQHEVERNKLTSQILVELYKALKQFVERGGFNSFIAEWKTLDSKLPSTSKEEDLFTKIINADKNAPGFDKDPKH